MTEYRIRWAITTDGRGDQKRRCIAEHRIFGNRLWIPFGEWRASEGEAEKDIDDHVALRRPLPPTRYITK